MEPNIYPEWVVGSHGTVFSGMWHARQLSAWRAAWAADLIDQVRFHGGDLYTVPSETHADKWYVVHHYRLAPDGYLWVCDCPASERGGVVCKHAFAAYLWFLERRMKWRLKKPDDDRSTATKSA